MDSKIAFVFPGQGSQEIGMGKDFVADFPVARRIFEEADDALSFSLSRLCFEGPEERLLLTEFTQPAILTASVAILRVVEEETDLRPSLVGGHSLGEYSALVAAGVLGFVDAVRAVRRRGVFMQEAVPLGTGGMAAVLGMEKDQVEDICREASDCGVVAPANFNSAAQIVIAGHTAALQRALELCRARGCKKALMLPVSAPFHSVLMKLAGERLRTFLEEIPCHAFRIPVVTNVEAEINEDPTRVRELLIAQVSSPVLWDASIRRMVSLGVDRFMEIGPGKVLTGLIKKIDKNVAVRTINTVESLKGLKA